MCYLYDIYNLYYQFSSSLLLLKHVKLSKSINSKFLIRLLAKIFCSLEISLKIQQEFLYLNLVVLNSSLKFVIIFPISIACLQTKHFTFIISVLFSLSLIKSIGKQQFLNLFLACSLSSVLSK